MDPRAAEEVAGTSWIGWDYFGKIERVESESIATLFFCLIVPVWPSHSIYETRSPDGELRYIPIPLQLRSVVLGLLRVHLGFAAVILLAGGLARMQPVLLALGAACLGTAVLTFAAGRLTPAERERRRLLRRATGIGAPPELLPRDLVAEIREELLDAWYAESPIPWYTAIVAGYASEILVALAEYHGRAALIEQARINMLS